MPLDRADLARLENDLNHFFRIGDMAAFQRTAEELEQYGIRTKISATGLRVQTISPQLARQGLLS